MLLAHTVNVLTHSRFQTVTPLVDLSPYPGNTAIMSRYHKQPTDGQTLQQQRKSHCTPS